VDALTGVSQKFEKDSFSSVIRFNGRLLCPFILQWEALVRIVCIFAAHGGGWGYSGSAVEAFRFCPDTDVLLGGFGLYGGRGTYNADLKVGNELH